MGVGGQRLSPAALPRGKTRYPLYRRLRGPQSWSWRVRKISPSPEFDPRTVQSVAWSLYRLSYIGMDTTSILSLTICTLITFAGVTYASRNGQFVLSLQDGMLRVLACEFVVSRYRMSMCVHAQWLILQPLISLRLTCGWCWKLWNYELFHDARMPN